MDRLVRSVQKKRGQSGDACAWACWRLADLIDDCRGVEGGAVRGVVLEQPQVPAAVVVEVEAGGTRAS